MMCKIGHHKYWADECAGRRAKSASECPYGASDVGRRCAWLAGYWDAHHE